MGRAPCCDKANVKKGPWSPEEDTKLKDYIQRFGTGGNWIALPHKAGLRRCGKSCRLRWLNYLRPNIKHGEFSDDEDRIICTLFATIGSRWSIIAAQLPGRTDNDIKNYWNTKLKKKLLGNAPSQKKPNQQQQQNQQLLFPTAAFASNVDVFTSLLHAATAAPSSSQYQISFGGGGNDQQSCSSSDITYDHHRYVSGLPMGFDQAGNSTLYGPLPSSLSELAPLEYGYEEIKQLITTTNTPSSYNNSTAFVNDPTATILGRGGVVVRVSTGEDIIQQSNPHMHCQ